MTDESSQHDGIADAGGPDDDSTKRQQPTEIDAEDNEPPKGEPNGPNAEAAKYRRRLRDTETERDAERAEKEHLLERIHARDRADVERHLADRLDRPADVWLLWDDVSRFYDEHGNLDFDAVDNDASEVLQERPSWAKRLRPPRDPEQGAGRAAGRDGFGDRGWLGVVRPDR